MFGFPSRLSCHATIGPLLEFTIESARARSITVPGELSLTRAGGETNACPPLFEVSWNRAVPLRYEAIARAPCMSRARYFCSVASVSNRPFDPANRYVVAPPSGDHIPISTDTGASAELRKCPPAKTRVPSTAIAGHTKVEEGQFGPHRASSKETVGGLLPTTY